jgi:alpha-L-fucosidase
LDIERGKLGKTRDLLWQTDTSISIKSWGYIENDLFRSVQSLLDELVDIVSTNGCLLLNVGPKPDGAIPDQAQKILLQMGDWLRVNGEAIYGTRPWTQSGEGPSEAKAGSFSDHNQKPFTAEDFRFTRKGNTLYAICLGWPEDAFRVKSLGSKKAPDMKVASVSMLGANEPLKWKQTGRELKVKAPASRPCEHAYALKIEMK